MRSLSSLIVSTGCVIGVDLGGTKLLAGAVDPALNVHHRATRPARGFDQNGLLDMIVAAVGEVRDAVDGASGSVDAVGFGIPCMIDQERGMAVMSNHLPIADLPFRDVMAERLGLPVFVDNDANAAMLAEWRFGAAAGARDAAMLTIGTGIGGGLVVGGALQRGSQGAGAELGHMVVQADGPPCPGTCPNRGCLEAMASGNALGREALRLARERPDSGLGRALAEGSDISGPLVTDLAHDGDAAAIEAVKTIGGWLGVGVCNLVNILNPDVVVIGGGVIAAGELLLEPIRALVAERALSPAREHVRILPARFGAESGMLGAAALALGEGS
ncbi:MAG: glucokinase [Solirubrobacteraceae bacterium]|jgi:glucokinase|nr:glucokinase [Solirubrobacteraceae bacterium]